MNKRHAAVIASCLILLAPAAIGAETIYRWTTEDGTVHFGSSPPEGVEATVVELAHASPSSPVQSPASAPTPGTPTEPEPRPLSAAQQQRMERAERRAAAAKAKAETQQRCEAMRRQRDELEPRPQVITIGKDGEPVRMDDEVRLAMIAEAKAYLAEHCD